MRFVAHDEIPATVWSFEFFLNIFVARELIEPGNNKVVLGKPVARTSGFEFVIGQNVEGELEALRARLATAQRDYRGKPLDNAEGLPGRLIPS